MSSLLESDALGVTEVDQRSIVFRLPEEFKDAKLSSKFNRMLMIKRKWYRLEGNEIAKTDRILTNEVEDFTHYQMDGCN